MSGKGKKQVDELELRRQLRRQSLQRDIEEEEESVMSEQDLTQYDEEIRIGGIEGGGTQSILLIIDGKGNHLTKVEGPCTNHWALGMVETTARIQGMVNRGKELLGLPEALPLDSLGLCLSGCEEDSTNGQIMEMLQEKYPNLSKDYVVASDTMGSLRTALDNGGIVLIAGTGSNALLINFDGKVIGCGGWGHMIGDEGSGLYYRDYAYWIAHQACKIVIDDVDGLVPAPEPTSYVWPALRQYFQVLDTKEMLPHVYTDFDKSHFASFTKHIATGCEKKDPLCLYLLREAGKYLAKHINALSNKAHIDLKLSRGGLKIICVGSVWKSWDFLKDGFMDEIHESRAVDELTMIRLTVSSAVGACYLAAEKIDWSFPKAYEDNTEVFHYYKRDNYVKPEITDSVESQIYLVPCNSMSAKEN